MAQADPKDGNPALVIPKDIPDNMVFLWALRPRGDDDPLQLMPLVKGLDCGSAEGIAPSNLDIGALLP